MQSLDDEDEELPYGTNYNQNGVSSAKQRPSTLLFSQGQVADNPRRFAVADYGTDNEIERAAVANLSLNARKTAELREHRKSSEIFATQQQ